MARGTGIDFLEIMLQYGSTHSHRKTLFFHPIHEQQLLVFDFREVFSYIYIYSPSPFHYIPIRYLSVLKERVICCVRYDIHFMNTKPLFMLFKWTVRNGDKFHYSKRPRTVIYSFGVSNQFVVATMVRDGLRCPPPSRSRPRRP